MKKRDGAQAEDAPVVLLTGFPGFIGARLVPRILAQQPEARLVCLVQEKYADAARASLQAIEAEHPHTCGRVGLVTGDVTVPGLGIDSRQVRELRRPMRQAWHLAAVYDLAVRREVGRRINVEGTKNVLEFLAHAPSFERLHYVSTAFVSGSARGTFRETDLDVGQGFKNHYEETKFQAEVEVARSRLPRTVYRPGIVVGDSRTGETAKFDGPYFVLRLMEKLPSPGVFLRVGMGLGTVNVVPVDFVIDAMAALAAHPASLGKTYHLCDPQPHSPAELSSMFAKALGKSFVFVPVPMAAAKAFFGPKPVQRLFGMPVQALDYFDDPVRHDTTQATKDLADAGIECPRLADYLPQLVSFYRKHRDDIRREAMV